MTRIAVLDHGYIETVESWGSDERIIEAARMSTDKGFQGWGPIETDCTCPHIEYHLMENPNGPGCVEDLSRPYPCDRCKGTKKIQSPGDEKLLAYLWNNKHATPFEMAGLIIEVQAPIFVFREWHRHRTQSYNELSARYTPMPDINYVPTIERLMINAGGTNKQAGTVKDAAALTEEQARKFQGRLETVYAETEGDYREALEAGIPKELARLVIPVGRYSRMRASANLRNWLAFLTLRNHHAAQWEIRRYAASLASLLEEKFPRTMELFNA
jgi:thymidylate synthase (FAD)